MDTMTGASTILRFCLLLACCGCAGVATDAVHDAAADFGRLRTYRWRERPAHFGMDELTARRVRESVDAELVAKGFVPSRAEPDFEVTVRGGIVEIDELANWPYRPRWARGNEVYRYREGTLIIDVIDPVENHVVWRGFGQTVLDHDPTPESRAERIDSTVRAILSRFPPPAPSPRPDAGTPSRPE